MILRKKSLSIIRGNQMSELVEGQVEKGTNWKDWPTYVAVKSNEGVYEIYKKTFSIGDTINLIKHNYVGNIKIYRTAESAVAAARKECADLAAFIDGGKSDD